MNPDLFDDTHHLAHDAEIQAQLCAYNRAFDELGLRFRWDARTLALLATIEGEEARIAAYIEAHHAHLLKAYSAGFLTRAILERKNARYPACLPTRVESAPQLGHAGLSPESRSGASESRTRSNCRLWPVFRPGAWKTRRDRRPDPTAARR